MMKVEYTDNGTKVVIPVELWETFKDVFEHIQLYELIQESKKSRQPLTHALEDILVEEQLNRTEPEKKAGIIVLKYEDERSMNMSRKEKLLKIFNESKGVLPENFKFDRQEIHERQSLY
jgi:hypothetical protein